MASHAFKVKRITDLGVEIVEADSDRQFVRHMHDHFGIGLVVHGAQRSASGRGQVEAHAGDLISVNPAEVHDGKPIGDGARRWHMLYFSPQLIAENFADMAADLGSRPCELAYPVLRNRQATVLFGTLYQTATQAVEKSSQLPFEENLSLLLEHMLDHAVSKPPVSGAAASRAKAMIDDDPLAAVSLASLAKESALSRFQLVRAFARLTGLTPHAYLIQRRIQRARHLIASGVPLAEASHASGFADQSHMTRHFVRSFGFSPGIYARQ